MKAIVVFDIDGVIRDVGGSYRKALADTVEHFTHNNYRPTMADIDALKEEGIWNNDWEGSQELIYRYFESQKQTREQINLNYEKIVDFFQSRYRGTNPNNWNGYITKEPLLVNKEYFTDLTNNNLAWAFFSGATRGSAEYILTRRLGLESPSLIAMEDAPGKPDPTGLFMVLKKVEKKYQNSDSIPVLYLGDTVADMTTIVKAKALKPERQWIAVGILPPHVQDDLSIKNSYADKLKKSGAQLILNNVSELISRFCELNLSINNGN